jgi:hypothetical protein
MPLESEHVALLCDDNGNVSEALLEVEDAEPLVDVTVCPRVSALRFSPCAASQLAHLSVVTASFLPDDPVSPPDSLSMLHLLQRDRGSVGPMQGGEGSSRGRPGGKQFDAVDGLGAVEVASGAFLPFTEQQVAVLQAAVRYVRCNDGIAPIDSIVCALVLCF